MKILSRSGLYFLALFILVPLLGAHAESRCLPILEFLGRKDAIFESWHPDPEQRLYRPGEIPPVEKPLKVYFYDIDVNLLHLDSHVYLRKMGSEEEVALSSAEYDKVSDQIGQVGTPWEHFYLVHDDDSPIAAHREARDLADVDAFKKQVIRAIEEYSHSDSWMGRAYVQFFSHLNAPCLQGKLGLLTSRGHASCNIANGLQVLVDRGLLPQNVDSNMIFGVSHPELTEFFLREFKIDPEMSESLGVPHQYEKKAFIMMELLDLLSSIPISPDSADQVHHFKYSDDSWGMLKHIMQVVEGKQLREKRWPNVEIHFYSTAAGQMGKYEVRNTGLEKVR